MIKRERINQIDLIVKHKPIGYMINCAYPSFLNAAKQPPEIFQRLIGYVANASSLNHCDLDGSLTLKTETVEAWGKEMITLNKSHGIKVLGGCCGTDGNHIAESAKRIR